MVLHCSHQINIPTVLTATATATSSATSAGTKIKVHCCLYNTPLVVASLFLSVCGRHEKTE